MYIDTKKMIAEQLFAILKHKKLEDVTIKYLVDACEISRQTFYYHFRDILDVLEWGTEQAIQEDLALSLQMRNPRDAIRVFVTRLAGNREVTRSLLADKHRAEFERILFNGFRTYFAELLRRKWPDTRLPAGDVEALLDFYTYGLVGLILRRCEAKEVDEERLIDQIDRLISGEMNRRLAAL